MKQIGLFTSLLPGQSSRTQSEELKEALAKEKIRKRLVSAASRGDEKKLSAVLSSGGDQFINDKDTTPLIAAAASGKMNAVQVLLASGADPYVEDHKAHRALEHARKGKHKDVAELLLNNMGDKEIFNILKSLGFARYWEPFVREQITFEQFKQFTGSDYDRMGLPIGPRKQIQRYLKELENGGSNQSRSALSSGALLSPRKGGSHGRGIPSGTASQATPGMGDKTNEGSSVSGLPSPRRKKGANSSILPLHSSTMTGEADNGRKFKSEIDMLSPYSDTSLPSTISTSTPSPRKTSHSPRSPRPQAKGRGQYVEYDQFDQQVKKNKSTKTESDSSIRHEKEEQLEENERKLLGQYVDYQKADVESRGKAEKKTEEDNDSDIYGGVSNLEKGAQNQTRTTPAQSDSDESSSESDGSSDEDISHDEGPGDERKYGYREIDYEELVFGKKIGAGAFGSVFKGTWRGAPVAIKKLKNFNPKDKHMVEEFRREARLAELVHNHPNIVKFVGACSKQKGKFCLVTMFCSSGSLDKILRDHSIQISLQQTVRMAIEAASGIYHLHCEGVIHRDIAARNCLVGENFHIFVTDFGFARIKENATAEYARTMNAVGPVKHMSPESMREKKYSEKSDAFSFGVLLWEVFTRQEPYEGEKDLVALAFRIAVQGYRLSIPSAVPAPISRLMKDCWETDPHKRPNFKMILKELSSFASTLEGSG